MAEALLVESLRLKTTHLVDEALAEFPEKHFLLKLFQEPLGLVQLELHFADADRMLEHLEEARFELARHKRAQFSAEVDQHLLQKEILVELLDVVSRLALGLGRGCEESPTDLNLRQMSYSLWRFCVEIFLECTCVSLRLLEGSLRMTLLISFLKASLGLVLLGCVKRVFFLNMCVAVERLTGVCSFWPYFWNMRFVMLPGISLWAEKARSDKVRTSV